MNERVVYYRNKIIRSLYKYALKPIFFLFDPESIHDEMTKFGKFLGRHRLGKKIINGMFGYKNPVLTQNVLGIDFKNPVGLSAGFDKNAELTDILPSVGFGFAEVGSVTGEFCPGNPKPRLARLPKSGSLSVNYGLKNDGCEKVAARLQKKNKNVPIGISVAMTNNKKNLEIRNAIKDYAKAFRTMEPLGSYITVNISCPNTLGGQPFLAPYRLDYLFDILDEIPTKKPVFIKMSPDIKESEIDAILEVAKRHRIHGIICTNLTKNRDGRKILDKDVPEKGSFSGKPVSDLADKMLRYIYRKEGSRFVLVGSGGVFTAEDAYKKIRLGASLVHMLTGMIFEGPQVISEINQGLGQLLKRDGFTSLKEAIGADNR